MIGRETEALSPGQVLPPAFFAAGALPVARQLIGSYLCRQEGPGAPIQRWAIHETEAYTGPDDKACHAAKGLTDRTRVMFGPPGAWYIYLCYGVHWMANIVCERDGYPAAVLLRGAGPTDGPGKLTKGMVITALQNGSLATPATGLWIEAAPPVPDDEVLVTPRIGIGYAAEWVEKPFRFIWKKATHDLKPARWKPAANTQASQRKT
ncbi:MAG: DNA-3-methyladenine glycosylase [Verrucomicrobiota bacterium JB022]|nr:DNA-3-methyladenine glycosylase [Verrucomicrobiota bacterium JB022]